MLGVIAATLLILASAPVWILASLGFGGFTLLTSFSLGNAVDATFSIPAFIWNWARFEHPIWAIVIALFLGAAGAGGRR